MTRKGNPAYLIIISEIFVLLILLVACSSPGATSAPPAARPVQKSAQSPCEQAIAQAAEIPDSSDSFNDLDKAIRICSSWAEFEAGVRKYPKAWTSMLGSPGSFSTIDGARMSCTDESLHNTPVCKKALEGVIFD